MGKFFAVTIFIGCIFFAGMFFGATMTEHHTSEIEPISSMYEEWKAEQHTEEKLQNTKEAEQKENVYSKTAKSFSNTLKNIARTAVFYLFSIFEKALGI